MKKIFTILLLSVTLPSWAQDTVKAWSGESELSFVNHAGNTVSNSLMAKQTLVYDLRPWRNTLKIEAGNVSSEVVDATTGRKVSVRTNEKYYLTEQLDRFISDLSYGFLRSTYEKDRFSGFENQSTYVLGYGRTLVDTDVFDMKAELGYGRSSDKLDNCTVLPCDPLVAYGDRENSQLWFFSEGLIWKISKSADAGQDLSVEDTSSNRISRFNIYIKSQLISNIATKLAYTLKYTDEVPAGKERKDAEFTVSLAYSF